MLTPDHHTGKCVPILNPPTPHQTDLYSLLLVTLQKPQRVASHFCCYVLVMHLSVVASAISGEIEGQKILTRHRLD